MADFIADSGADIELLTFHAFRFGENLFLARRVEISIPRPPREPPGASTKEGNLRALRENAEALGVAEFLHEVADFLSDSLPGYRWPGKTAYSFSLAEKTGQGKPTLRTYVTLYLPYVESSVRNCGLQAKSLMITP